MKFLLLFAVSIFAMSSCSNDEDLALQDGEESLPVWMTQDGHFDVNLYNASVMDSAWRELSLDDRKKAFNIPEDVLSTLTTTELLYACTVNPFALTYVGFPNPYSGLIYSNLEYYNGYQELLRRANYKEVTAEYVTRSEYLKNFKQRVGSDNFIEYYAAGIALLLLDNQTFIEDMDKSVAEKLLKQCIEYQSSGYLYDYPLVYIGQFNEDGTPFAHPYVIDSVVHRLTEYLQEQD